jgi:hypothetical protein
VYFLCDGQYSQDTLANTPATTCTTVESALCYFYQKVISHLVKRSPHSSNGSSRLEPMHYYTTTLLHYYTTTLLRLTLLHYSTTALLHHHICTLQVQPLLFSCIYGTHSLYIDLLVNIMRVPSAVFASVLS